MLIILRNDKFDIDDIVKNLDVKIIQSLKDETIFQKENKYLSL